VNARQTNVIRPSARLLVAVISAATVMLLGACQGDGDGGVSQPGPCSPAVVANAPSLSALKERLRDIPLSIETVRRQREGVKRGTRVFVLEDGRGRAVKQVRVWKRDDGRWVAREYAIACQ